MTTRQKAERLLELHHQEEPLVLCNAWDAASARIMEEVGYSAVATSSSGMANSLGFQDGEHAPASEMMAALRRIAQTVRIPVTADAEAGYGDPVGITVAIIEAGAVGLNLEDFSNGSLIPLEHQIEVIRKVRETAESLGVPLVINARTDIFLHRIGASEERYSRTVERLSAYAEAGASCLFAPGVQDVATIGALVNALPLPLNILAMKGSPSIPELAALGVKRISVGGGPMRASMGLTKQIAQTLMKGGPYDSFLNFLMPGEEANELFCR